MPDLTAIALSGGVDSSVAAALLVEAGRDVIGLTMRLGAGDESISLAAHVCDALGIEHVVVDLAERFASEVVAPFARAYASGLTPNPCVLCNERIKFGLLAEYARSIGATRLATGHYARLAHDGDSVWLERGTDAAKDQSYFLYRVPAPTLEMLDFPLGDLTKAEVRAIAGTRGLPTASRRESQEVCFTGDHVALVASLFPDACMPGPIVSEDGVVLGTHGGIARYTVGQRKGLALGGGSGPLRVVRIDASRNAVVVLPEPLALQRDVLLAEAVWRLGDGPTRVEACVRYRAAPVSAVASLVPQGLHLDFAEPVGVLAPGQSVVCYRGARVVGGGVVTGTRVESPGQESYARSATGPV